MTPIASKFRDHSRRAQPNSQIAPHDETPPARANSRTESPASVGQAGRACLQFQFSRAPTQIRRQNMSVLPEPIQAVAQPSATGGLQRGRLPTSPPQRLPPQETEQGSSVPSAVRGQPEDLEAAKPRVHEEIPRQPTEGQAGPARCSPADCGTQATAGEHKEQRCKEHPGASYNALCLRCLAHRAKEDGR